MKRKEEKKKSSWSVEDGMGEARTMD